MIIKLKKRIPKRLVKLSCSPSYMAVFFNKKWKKYYPFLPRTKKLTVLEIKILRNFLKNFTKLVLEYSLKINGEKKIIRGRIDAVEDFPKRYFNAVKFLQENKFKNCPFPLDYLPRLNLFLYKDIPGTTLQDMLESQGQIAGFIGSMPRAAKLIKQIHSLPTGHLKNIIPQKDEKKINQENIHWLSLIKSADLKIAKKFKTQFSQFIKYYKKIKNCFSFYPALVHGDLHFGNIIKQKNKIFLLDFSDSHLGDPLQDVGHFLIQTKSMIYHYLPTKNKPLKAFDKISNIFLQEYFRRTPTNQEMARIYFWQIRSLFQMIAFFAFLFPSKESAKQEIHQRFQWVEICFNKFKKLNKI